ncbi:MULTISPECIES: hypothetical protein [unclassified Variovorax]|uniref:hypothetical protein n=1 Tax=unclassified Variovorax TaxID=663243 RepID=UPI00131697F3|nr:MULTISPECIES: hypothetical protein [unclassified Variovorax]VTU30570.1 hypothetical protein E5CHR_03041 [Variovorax sp. PBL-E5]
MEIPDLNTVVKARRAIEEVIAGRRLGTAAVPYFAPTDLGGLPASIQEAELRIKEDNDHGNRVRAAIHMSLTAAAAALKVSEDLMEGFAELPSSERQLELARCSTNARAASDAAGHAAAVLAGEESPKSDSMMEIKRLGSAIFQRFGNLPKP